MISCDSYVNSLQPHDIAVLEKVESLKDNQNKVGKRQCQVNHTWHIC